VHSLRAIAILFVVAGHCVWFLPTTGDSRALRIFMGLFGDGSVVFVFVAGFLFCHLHQGFEYGSYLKKKLSNIVVPYLLVSIPAIVLALFRHDPAAQYPQLAGHSVLYRILWFYIKGGAHMDFPLWFIPVIALYFLAAPLFSHIIGQPALFWVVPPLFVVSALLHRPQFPNLDTFHAALYLLPAYLMGMWAGRSDQTTLKPLQDRPFLLYALLIVCWMIPFALDNHIGNHEESGYFTFETGIIDWLFVQKALLAVLLALALKRWPEAWHRRLSPLADTSFAVFFVHAYWLRVASHAFAQYPVQGGLLTVCLFTAVIYALSHGTALTVKAVFPRYSRYLIGY
jgi:surface polysaccharide O-acyltransferase-like enzyme